MLRIFLLTVLFVSIDALAQPFTVIGISDGDTVRVLSATKQQVRCRLYGIDAPEKNQAFGQASKQSLSEMIYRRTVDIEIVNEDLYGRSVCRITLNGLDVNREQIVRGMAWMYRRYSHDASYSLAEASAKERRLGLWADSNPMPPWDFRKSEKNMRKIDGNY